MKIKKDVTYYNTAKYFANGHFAVRKDVCKYVGIEKVGSLVEGKYLGDLKVGSVDDSITNILESHFLRDREGYVRAELTTEARIDPASHKVITIIMKTEDGTAVGIDPKYTDLLSLGDPFIKGPKDPILVVRDGEIRAVVMPIKL